VKVREEKLVEPSSDGVIVREETVVGGVVPDIEYVRYIAGFVADLPPRVPKVVGQVPKVCAL
jgi:hypothetical protein